MSKTKKLQSDIENLEIKVQSTSAELEAMRGEIVTKNSAIADLTARLNALNQERDNFAEIQSKNVHLRLELDEVKRTKSDDRRRSRQSLHDDLRPGLRGAMRTAQVQTDPTDSSCQCNDLAAKIDKLKKDLMVVQLKLDTHDMQTNYRVDKEREATKEWKKKAETLHIEVIKLRSERATCKVCAAPRASRTTQTDEDDETAIFKKKYEVAKKLCQMRNERIQKLEQDKGKENQVQNDQLNKALTENVLLKKSIVDLEAKCRKVNVVAPPSMVSSSSSQEVQTTGEFVTQDEYTALEELITEKNTEFEALKTRHHRWKVLCVNRKESLSNLEEHYRSLKTDYLALCIELGREPASLLPL